MDFEMKDYYDEETREHIWDFDISKGKLGVVDHAEAEFQRAVVATFVQRGTVPQIQGFGNQWAELLTGQVTPQQLNAQIRDSIASVVDGMKFVPKYSMKDGKLLVEIKEAS